MTSELDLFLLGVEFIRSPSGRIVRVVGPANIDIRAAVLERSDRVKLRLAGATAHPSTRTGICDTCGEPMALLCRCTFCQAKPPDARWQKHGHQSNKSGICDLCLCATQKIVERGEWPSRHSEVSKPVDIESQIAALPPKPKAPWEVSD